MFKTFKSFNESYYPVSFKFLWNLKVLIGFKVLCLIVHIESKKKERFLFIYVTVDWRRLTKKKVRMGYSKYWKVSRIRNFVFFFFLWLETLETQIRKIIKSFATWIKNVWLAYLNQCSVSDASIFVFIESEIFKKIFTKLLHYQFSTLLNFILFIYPHLFIKRLWKPFKFLSMGNTTIQAWKNVFHKKIFSFTDETCFTNRGLLNPMRNIRWLTIRPGPSNCWLVLLLESPLHIYFSSPSGAN